MSTNNIELETSLLNKLVAEDEDNRREIKIREKKLKDNEPLIRALKLKLGDDGSTAKQTGYGSKVQIVQKIIDLLPKAQFTQNDIEAEMLRTNPDAEINRDRIRAVIWSLAKKHKTIKLIRKGNNRQPAEFERLANQANGSKVPPRPVPQRFPRVETLVEL